MILSLSLIKNRKKRYGKGKELLSNMSKLISNSYNQKGVQDFLKKAKLNIKLDETDAEVLLMHVSDMSDAKLTKITQNKAMKFLKKITGSFYTAEESRISNFVSNLSSTEKQEDFINNISDHLFPSSINKKSQITNTSDIIEEGRLTRDKKHEKQAKEDQKNILSQIKVKEKSKSIELLHKKVSKAINSIQKTDDNKDLKEEGKSILVRLVQFYNYINTEPSPLTFSKYSDFNSFGQSLEDDSKSLMEKCERKATEEAAGLLDEDSPIKD